MSLCPATIPWDITPDLGSDLPCTLGEGHKSRHHTTLTEKRTLAGGRVVVDIETTVSWTNDA